VASPGSIQMMAKPGMGILIVPQRPWEDLAPEFEAYRAEFLEVHARPAPPPIATAWVFCDEDPGRASEVGARYMTRYWTTVLDHYQYNTPEAFKGVKGYENYVGQAEGIKAAGNEAAAKDFMDVQVWGTPDQCIEKIRSIHEHVGCRQFTGIFRFADMPYDEAERSMRVFADKVVPALKKIPDPA